MRADSCDLDDEHLLRALDHIRDVFAVFDDRNRLVYWNAHSERRSGYSAEELAGMHPKQLVADADLPKLGNYLRDVHQSGRSTVEVRLVAKNGERVPHELYSDLLTDADGSVIGRVVVGREISERWAYERVLEHKSDRLQEFADFVSHDIRTPLSVASGWLDAYHETGSEVHYQRVVDAHERIEQVVDDLLGLTSFGGVIEDIEPVDVGNLAWAVWRSVPTGDATLRVDDTGTVMADRGLLRQALTNLFDNAVHHAGPAVTVRVGPLDRGFFVADDGPGFPEEPDESVFEAGVSTSPEGTGLGLTIVDEIATMHGWSIDATDGSQGGARIEFKEAH
jgi:PAS domain S-box-containing protein